MFPLWVAHEVAENEAATDEVAHFEGSGDTEELPDGVALTEAEREGTGEREAPSLVLGDGLALELRVAQGDTVVRGVTVALFVFGDTVPLWLEEMVELGEPVHELVAVDVPVWLPVPQAVDEAQPVPEPLLVADSVAVAEGEPVQELDEVDESVLVSVLLTDEETQRVPVLLLVADPDVKADAPSVCEKLVE